MLRLKQVTQPFTWERDHITNDYITYGQFYYEDDKDGLVISRDTYVRFKKEKERAEWDYSNLERLASQREYEEVMKEQTRQMLADTLMDRKVENPYD